MGHLLGRWIESAWGIKTGQLDSWPADNFLDLNAVYSSFLASRNF